jgi:hypothetical protein
MEGLGQLKKFIHFIGSQTRDLPACRVVPQPLRYCVPPNVDDDDGDDDDDDV